MQNEDIKELLLHLKNDEMNYFDEFYNKTKKAVFYMAYSILRDYELAEDVLQEVYLKFLKHLKRVDVDKPVIGYLMKIAKNLSLNHLKKKEREVKVEVETIVSTIGNKTELVEESELLKKVEKILKPEEFQIVVLHVISELTHKEIAEITKRPLGSVTWAYSNAIKKLRRELENEN